MTEELKPCPFCGGVEILRANAMFGWVCLCRSCSARGPSPNNATDVEAAAAWNTRAESAGQKPYPVALETFYELIINWDEGGGKRSRRELARRIVALYASAESAERKPAAWMKKYWGPDCGPQIEVYKDSEMGWRDRKEWTPLYTHPESAEVERLREENANLRTVMVAAAEEISTHWDAHCDDAGCGPVNLMRRLEYGIPTEYGYKAGDFERLRARVAELEAEQESMSKVLAMANESLAELEAAQAWRPIEGAPKDESLIVVNRANWWQGPRIASWDEEGEGFCERECGPWIEQPTHYLPLPPMPEEL